MPLAVGKWKHIHKEMLALVNTLNDAFQLLKTKVGLGANSVRAVEATTATVALGDANGQITISHADPAVVSLPKDIITAGQHVDITWLGVGTVTIDPGADVTINGATANVTVSQRYSTGRLRCVAANTFTWEPGFLTP